MPFNPEYERLKNTNNNEDWKKWGPYLSDRQWGTVREDYSSDGNAWNFIPHEKARSNAYRWGEEGIGGISDNKQFMCFAPGFWNGNDPILKERLFGLTGHQGNHGEDVKELYYYLDSSPTHSYMKMLYKYPQRAFPYQQLVDENRNRGKNDREFEIINTGIFDHDEYFDITIEYVKNHLSDIFIKIKATNRAPYQAKLDILPTLWFRNTWNAGITTKPHIRLEKDNCIKAKHPELGEYYLYANGDPKILFCENETNQKIVYNQPSQTGYYKDGINDYVINGNQKSINPAMEGTKMAFHFSELIDPDQSCEVILRLTTDQLDDPFKDIQDTFEVRKKECDLYYDRIQKNVTDPELKKIQREAFAGMLWSKQFYYYDVYKWIYGDHDSLHNDLNQRRNANWTHMYAQNILSMPDKWEYPWFAAWDLAFHTVTLVHLDHQFAKRQLLLLLREYYMHPNGQIPAYEWNFSDVNPPVHAWAAWNVFEESRKITGSPDYTFLESVFHKLISNFTWWINQKDREGNNVFEGGFLGLDNIGVFDRSHLPKGVNYLEQADATSWMAMYSLNMLRIALQLSEHDEIYEESASKFFRHFLSIGGAMANMGKVKAELWDDEDHFYYDMVHLANGATKRLKIRSLVGIIPMFAVEVIPQDILDSLKKFTHRITGFLEQRPDLAALVSNFHASGQKETHMASIIRKHRLSCIINYLSDENEFLSDYGIRSLSKFHKDNPYSFSMDGTVMTVSYQPEESNSGMFGGNSNWRGPVWFPLNYMIITSIDKYAEFYGDSLQYEFPKGSGNKLTLAEIATELRKRLLNIFKRNENSRLPYHHDSEKMNIDKNFDHHLFYEYFDPETGRGLGASHQTGWTGLIANVIMELHS